MKVLNIFGIRPEAIKIAPDVAKHATSDENESMGEQ